MEELKELGLSENEITVYLSLLKLGSVSANSISKISGLKRSTTYDNLQLLISKGIVASTIKNSVAFYTAAEPKKLVHILQDKVRRVKDIIPELEKLQTKTPIDGGVTYYEGKKGVLTVLNDVLDVTNKEFYFIGSRKKSKIPLKHYPDNFVQRRIEKNIKAKGILAYEDKKDSFIEEAKAQKLSSFSYDKQLNDSSAIMFSYEGKTAFITTKEDPVGVIIDNADITDFLRKVIFKRKK